MRIYSDIMHSMKIIFENLVKLVLKIEIDLGRENQKFCQSLSFVKSAFLHHAIPLSIRIFRDSYDF